MTCKIRALLLLLLIQILIGAVERQTLGNEESMYEMDVACAKARSDDFLTTGKLVGARPCYRFAFKLGNFVVEFLVLPVRVTKMIVRTDG